MEEGVIFLIMPQLCGVNPMYAFLVAVFGGHSKILLYNVFFFFYIIL